jgi:hypothetical protein
MEFNASEEWLRKTAEAEDGANINIGSPSPGPIIFFVTVLHDKQKRKRTWGWYLKFKDAEKAVLENHTDIFEMGYYNLAVISAFPEGVLAVEEMTWSIQPWNRLNLLMSSSRCVAWRSDEPICQMHLASLWLEMQSYKRASRSMRC